MGEKRDRHQIDLGKHDLRSAIEEIRSSGAIAYRVMTVTTVIETALLIGIAQIKRELSVLGYLQGAEASCVNLSQLIKRNWDELEKTRIDSDRLIQMRDHGAKTNPLERCRIAQALGISESVIEELERGADNDVSIHS